MCLCHLHCVIGDKDLSDSSHMHLYVHLGIMTACVCTHRHADSSQAHKTNIRDFPFRDRHTFLHLSADIHTCMYVPALHLNAWYHVCQIYKQSDPASRAHQLA